MSKKYWEDREDKAIKRTNTILDRLPDFVTSFIEYISNSTSALTRENYIRDIDNFFDYIESELAIKKIEITPETLSTLSVDFFSGYTNKISCYEKNGKTYKTGEVTKARRLSSIRSLFKYLYTSEKIPENKTTKIKPLKLDEKEIIRLENDESLRLLNTIITGKGTEDSEQAQRFNEQLGTRDYTIIALLLNTGIRVSECVGLDINDIDTVSCSLRVIRKGHSEYTTLYYNDQMGEILEDYLAYRCSFEDVKEGHEKALFLSNRKQRITVRSVEILVSKYTERAGIIKHISPHKLRSTYGTSFYEATGDIRATANVLGHKSIETTSRRYVETGREARARLRGAVTLLPEDD
jgi:Site-specific recombinase XerD